MFKTVDGGNSWTSASAGMTGDVRGVTIDPLTTSVIYAGTPAGLFKSTDGAASWSQNPSGPAGSVSSIVLDPSHPDTVYAGGSPTSIYKSLDAGTTWTRLIDSPWTLRLAIDPSVPATIYSAGPSLSRTRNGGGLWTRSEAGLHATDATSIVIAPTTPPTIHAANYHAMFSTSDGGATWTHAIVPTSDPFWLAFEPRKGIVSFISHPSRGYASAYWSRDGGARWRNARGLATNQPTSLVADPAAPRVLYAGTFDGIFQSRNGGRGWRPLRSNPPDPVVTGVAVDPTSRATLYATTGYSGVFKTTDGGRTWSAMNGGLGDLVLRTIAIDPTAPSTLYVASWAYDRIFKSTDGGASWTEGSTGLPQGPTFAFSVGSLLVDPGIPSTVYAGVAHGGVFRSTDGGATWSDYNLGMTAQAVGELLVGPPASSIYAATSQGVYRLVR